MLSLEIIIFFMYLLIRFNSHKMCFPLTKHHYNMHSTPRNISLKRNIDFFLVESGMFHVLRHKTISGIVLTELGKKRHIYFGKQVEFKMQSMLTLIPCRSFRSDILSHFFYAFFYLPTVTF